MIFDRVYFISILIGGATWVQIIKNAIEAFHITIIPLRKVWIQLILHQL